MRITIRAHRHLLVMCKTAAAKLKKHNRLAFSMTLIFSVIAIVYGPTVFHVIKEFVAHSNFNFNLCKRFHQMTHVETKQTNMPKVINQVFINASINKIEFFEKYRPYMQSWREMNPDFQYILWNSSMIDNLINTSYPSIARLYERYRDMWMARTDIARYVVVHYMGGVYADIDIVCKKRMSDLYQEIGDKTVVLNYTYSPFGIANDFFMAGKNHEFMAHVIDGLQEADVLYFTPYLNSMFRTGPMYLLGRYLNYIHQEDIHFLQKSQIYTDSESRDSTWYNFDGYVIAIVWNGVGSLQILSVILMIVFIVRLNKLISIRRKLVRKSRRQVQFFDRRTVMPIPEEEPA